MSARGVAHPALDGLGGILPPPDEPGSQRLDRRGEDEDGHRLGERLAHLARTLPVDVEDHVPSPREPVPERAPRGAVAPIEDPGVFEELAGVHHPIELAPVHEVVVDAVRLAGARGPRGMRDAERDARVGFGQRAREARLPGPRRRAQHQHPRFPTGRPDPLLATAPRGPRRAAGSSARDGARGSRRAAGSSARGSRRTAGTSPRIIRRSGSARASAR